MEKEPELQEVKVAREVVGRAIRRLNALEYLILFLAVGLALAAGAVVGWLLSYSFGLSFRWGWAGSSMLLFLIPAGVAYLREARPPEGAGRRTEPPHSEGGREVTSKPKGFHG